MNIAAHSNSCTAITGGTCDTSSPQTINFHRLALCKTQTLCSSLQRLYIKQSLPFSSSGIQNSMRRYQVLRGRLFCEQHSTSLPKTQLSIFLYTCLFVIITESSLFFFHARQPGVPCRFIQICRGVNGRQEAGEGNTVQYIVPCDEEQIGPPRTLGSHCKGGAPLPQQHGAPVQLPLLCQSQSRWKLCPCTAWNSC